MWDFMLFDASFYHPFFLYRFLFIWNSKKFGWIQTVNELEKMFVNDLGLTQRRWVKLWARLAPDVHLCANAILYGFHYLIDISFNLFHTTACIMWILVGFGFTVWIIAFQLNVNVGVWKLSGIISHAFIRIWCSIKFQVAIFNMLDARHLLKEGCRKHVISWMKSW